MLDVYGKHKDGLFTLGPSLAILSSLSYELVSFLSYRPSW